ncbi:MULTISPECIES: sigma-70 family RNA polymerase sigma factor [Streptomyces griseus group]|uniref:RNA polymerase sigma factor n=1 Tax=Streptomyces griseus group TaxID=629295 RepID=UPI002E0D9DC2|nr:sigma-70 family RNA polymerase sigma factor [Streptomyces cyaneofuscatus]WSI52703.1 sigma-70 family RNA polymerase sigma factor [Streptomyces cyaneofuscatus]WST12508.1 sigma-70 family RNA polymerase sigma factor [Streptomyces microflavus]WST19529.1 sigma-70 family RNA polymerase sigma factor [Streptomyces microflavus]
MSPGDGGGSEAGHTYLTKLGTASFDALMKQVIASLAGFRQLNAAEREDVAIEAIYHAVSRKQFDPSDQPAAYIKTIARNMALKKIEELKKPKTEVARVLMDHTDLDTLACTTVDADEAEQEQELTDLVVEVLGQIASPQQRKVTERTAQGEEAADIASSLGVSTQQVYTQYHRARTKVRASPQISPFVREAYVRPSKDGE